jgi:enamine deaminase RidA (YjgF/YER057c/UK114 family)
MADELKVRMQRFLASPARLPGISDTPISTAIRHGERVFLSGASALQPDGSVAGLGDPAAQANAALDRLEAALSAAGGSLASLTKLTTCIVDRGYRSAAYAVIAQRLPNVRAVSTGLVVAGLPLPELIIQIDAEAAIPRAPPRYTRPYDFESWHGQGFPWQGSMVLATDDEFFVRGQTGASLDHTGVTARGRSIADAASQAETTMENLATILSEAGASLEDICKITVYIGDRAYRSAIYPVIGKHLAGVRPVSTGIITTGFARPDIVFELDTVVVRKQGGAPHRRVRPYHSSAARYGHQGQQLDCEFCMAVVAGDRVILRGQTGMGLDEKLYGVGDAKAQAEQAMRNVEALLQEAGASLADVVKATVYVTDRAFLPEVNAAVLSRLGNAPAFTAVIVKGLASPELLMEVDITAIKDGAR